MIRNRIPMIVAAAIGLLALGGPAATPARSAMASYVITANTSGLDGTPGNVEFSFNPVDSGTGTATAVVTGFSIGGGGSLAGPIDLMGGATGSLASTLSIANSTGSNDATQGVNYGTTITFDLTITYTPETVNGTLFSFFMEDAGFTGYNAGPSGQALDVLVLNTTTVTTYAPRSNSPGYHNGTPVVTVGSAAVPEPSSLVLMGLGAAALAFGARMRRRAA
jgi:PEP-CTERM motif